MIATVRGAVCCLAGVVIHTTSASAQSRPDFSGTWTQDTTRTASVGGGRGQRESPGGGRGGGLGLGPPAEQLTIQQTTTTLTIDERRGTTTSRLVYALTGKTSKNTIAVGRGAGASAQYVSKWKNAHLVTTITAPASSVNKTKLQYEETRYIDPDGALVVETTLLGQPNVRRLVYAKSK
jgi:hypothetical protein